MPDSLLRLLEAAPKTPLLALLGLLLCLLALWAARGEVRYWQDNATARSTTHGPAAAGIAGLLSLLVADFITPQGLVTPAWSFPLLAGLLCALGAIDLTHRLLPDRLTLTLGVGGLLLSLASVQPWLSLAWSAAGVVLGGLLPMALVTVHRRLFRRDRDQALGRGDVYLLGAVGAWLGPIGVAESLLWASLLMLPLIVVGLLLMGWTRKTALPFGPALALGALLSAMGVSLISHPVWA